MFGVGLGQVEGDHAFVVPGDHLGLRAGQQVEGQAFAGGLVPGFDRQPQLGQLEDQTALGHLPVDQLSHAFGVVVGRACAGEYTGLALASAPAGTNQLHPVTTSVAHHCHARTGEPVSTRWSVATSVRATTSRR